MLVLILKLTTLLYQYLGFWGSKFRHFRSVNAANPFFHLKFSACSLKADFILSLNLLSTSITILIKGTGHDFRWSGKPINHFQKQGNMNKGLYF